jgi:hypothetical protein
MVDCDHGIGEGAGRFLRQVVADAARDQLVLVLAGKALGV